MFCKNVGRTVFRFVTTLLTDRRTDGFLVLYRSLHYLQPHGKKRPNKDTADKLKLIYFAQFCNSVVFSIVGPTLNFTAVG